MIEIEERKNDEGKYKVLLILSEGFGEAGYVQSEVMMDKNDKFGDFVSILTWDHEVIKNGDYSPHDLSKSETLKLAEFLMDCHSRMRD